MTFAPKSDQFFARYSLRVDFFLTGLQRKAPLCLAVHKPTSAAVLQCHLKRAFKSRQ